MKIAKLSRSMSFPPLAVACEHNKPQFSRIFLTISAMSQLELDRVEISVIKK